MVVLNVTIVIILGRAHIHNVRSDATDSASDL